MADTVQIAISILRLQYMSYRRGRRDGLSGGLCAAIDQVFPTARRQRCVIHRARNVVAKVSAADQAAVKADFWEIFDLPEEVEPGQAAVAEASRRAEQFAATWRPRYPAAADCLLDDFELLTAHLHHPRAHWPRLRHTNLIERTFGETRRRVKVIGRLPGERSALSLVWAVLDRAVAGWRGITYTPADTRQLQTIRRELGISRPRPKEEPATPDAVAVTPAA
jgi:transposase-like protein